MFLPTLYSRRSDGVTVQVYKMEVEGNCFRTHVGIQDGAIVTSAWTTCKGKNQGKVNETTDEQQAMLEAKARWTKKLNEKYVEDINSIDTGRLVEPMLAKEFKDREAKLFDTFGNAKEPLYAQPKLDGVRCIYKATGPESRKGKKFFAYPHIADALKPLFDANPDLILDGEFYNHDLKGDFERIVSLVKKQTPNFEQIFEARDNLQYHIYDIPSSRGTFSERHKELCKLLSQINHPAIRKVETVYIDKKYDNNTPSLSLDTWYEHWLDLGYEGQMIRTDTPYEFKRTYALLKRKEFMDEEFIIDGIFEGTGNKSGMAGYVTLAHLDGRKIYSKNGEQAKANIKANWEFCKRLLRDKDSIIGKQGTVTFFRYNETGAPYLPRLVRIRDYE